MTFSTLLCAMYCTDDRPVAVASQNNRPASCTSLQALSQNNIRSRSAPPSQQRLQYNAASSHVGPTQAAPESFRDRLDSDIVVPFATLPPGRPRDRSPGRYQHEPEPRGRHDPNLPRDCFDDRETASNGSDTGEHIETTESGYLNQHRPRRSYNDSRSPPPAYSPVRRVRGTSESLAAREAELERREMELRRREARLGNVQQRLHAPHNQARAEVHPRNASCSSTTSHRPRASLDPHVDLRGNRPGACRLPAASSISDMFMPQDSFDFDDEDYGLPWGYDAMIDERERLRRTVYVSTAINLMV